MSEWDVARIVYESICRETGYDVPYETACEHPTPESDRFLRPAWDTARAVVAALHDQGFAVVPIPVLKDLIESERKSGYRIGERAIALVEEAING